MTYELNSAKLSEMLRIRRAGRGLREFAEEIGEVSPSTLSRLENGHTPDMNVFLIICNYLKVDPNTFFIGTDKIEASIGGQMLSLALSDKLLDETGRKILTSVIQTLYP